MQAACKKNQIPKIATTNSKKPRNRCKRTERKPYKSWLGFSCSVNHTQTDYSAPFRSVFWSCNGLTGFGRSPIGTHHSFRMTCDIAVTGLITLAEKCSYHIRRRELLIFPNGWRSTAREMKKTKRTRQIDTNRINVLGGAKLPSKWKYYESHLEYEMTLQISCEKIMRRYATKYEGKKKPSRRLVKFYHLC